MTTSPIFTSAPLGSTSRLHDESTRVADVVACRDFEQTAVRLDELITAVQRFARAR